MNSLKGKTAIITGVSRRNGIGYGIAEKLASRGANLFLHSFTPYDKMMSLNLKKNESELIFKSLSEYGTIIEQMEADFMNPESPAVVVKKANNSFKHIEILIVNHTYDTLKSLSQLTVEEIDKHLIINVRASLTLIKEFVEQYSGNSGGRIILLTSGQHLGPMTDLAYVASKGALHQLTNSLSDILIEKGITVNSVNPGPTKTYIPCEEINKAVLERMPQERWGEPDDVARLIAWLISDEAGWVTGQVIDSEGGFRRG